MWLWWVCRLVTFGLSIKTPTLAWLAVSSGFLHQTGDTVADYLENVVSFRWFSCLKWTCPPSYIISVTQKYSIIGSKLSRLYHLSVHIVDYYIHLWRLVTVALYRWHIDWLTDRNKRSAVCHGHVEILVLCSNKHYWLTFIIFILTYTFENVF